MQGLPYDRVLVIRPLPTILYTSSTKKVQKIILGLDKSDFNNNTASPDLYEPISELDSFKVQTREELDKSSGDVPVTPV